MLAVLQALRQENEYDLTIDKQDCVNFMWLAAFCTRFHLASAKLVSSSLHYSFCDVVVYPHGFRSSFSLTLCCPLVSPFSVPTCFACLLTRLGKTRFFGRSKAAVWYRHFTYCCDVKPLYIEGVVFINFFIFCLLLLHFFPNFSCELHGYHTLLQLALCVSPESFHTLKLT